MLILLVIDAPTFPSPKASEAANNKLPRFLLLLPGRSFEDEGEENEDGATE